MPKVLVLLAQGSEEIEAVVTVDVLRRAKIEVTLASVASKEVKCSRGVVLSTDASLDENIKNLEEFDAVVLPGGLEGAKTFAQNDKVLQLLNSFKANKKLIAAICAAPLALKAAGLKGFKLTSYPSFKKDFVESGYEYLDEKVVKDGQVITSRGPGTSFDFALAIVTALSGDEIAAKVAEGLLWR